jgi:putative tryptophan/tyrosine transport system substrate-binding protein
VRRREVIASIGAAAALPVAAHAQQTDRTYRIGILAFPRRQAPPAVAIVDGLRSAGFVEGKNLIVDERGFGLRENQFAIVARQMAQSNVDVLVGLSGGPTIRGAQAATTTIPIVGVGDDMVQEGFVGSFTNRGGNTTGMSILAVELNGKRQEILMEMLPKARRMAVLADAGVWLPAQIGALQEAARRRGVDLLIKRVVKSADALPALEQAKAEGAEAGNLLASPLFDSTSRRAIFAKATMLGLPTISQWPESINEGAVLAYGPNLVATFRQLGSMIGKVLRGTPPNQIPIEQPTKIELAVNLKVARELGITVPTTLVQRADEVVE